jgi:uncharacterized metal-binding protein YceD (DUF177 family)
MRITVEHIPDDGLDVTASMSDPWAREAAGQSLEGEPQSVELSVHVDRVAGSPTLRVRGEAAVVVARDCDRCGAPLKLEVSGPVDLYYHPPELAPEEDNESLHSDELDIGWYDGITLEMDAVFSEQLALWLPERVRCTDPGVEPSIDPVECQLPEGDREVDLDTHRPFAGLKLPE